MKDQEVRFDLKELKKNLFADGNLPSANRLSMTFQGLLATNLEERIMNLEKLEERFVLLLDYLGLEYVETRVHNSHVPTETKNFRKIIK